MSAVFAIALGLTGGVVPGEAARAATIREQQWHLDALKIKQVHQVATGKGVVVAVIDGGVQPDHPDLAGRVLDGTRPWPKGSNVRPDDEVAHVDSTGHGTGVAGLIAASGRKGGALGIAPDAEILPIGVPTEVAGGGDLVGQGIRWAADHGAQVINISLVRNQVRISEQEAVKYALDKNVVIVASGGNLKQAPQMQPPGSFPGVLAVSAVDEKGTFWPGGTRGARMGMAAPGLNMATLSNKKGGYIIAGGSSAATPIVAGAAALIREKYPDLPVRDVINRLTSTAVDAGPPGRDEQYGFGRLDLVQALTAKVAPVGTNPVGEPVVDPAEEVDLSSSETTGFTASTPLMMIVGGAVLAVVALVAIIVLVVRRRSPRV